MSAPKHNRGEGRAHVWRHPSLGGGRKRFLAAAAIVTGLVLVPLSIVTADDADAGNPCTTTASGKLCASASVDNAAGTVTISLQGTNLTTSSYKSVDLSSGSHTDSTSGRGTADGNGTYSYSHTFAAFTPDANTATVTLTGQPSSTFGSLSASVDFQLTPSSQTVTPTEPAHTTPDCTSQNETVTPSNQAGVIWSPSGSTTLKPGKSVTYTAAPGKGYEFPKGAQTSFPFTNGFDTSKCTTAPPTPMTKTVSWVMVDPNGSASHITFPQDEVSPKRYTGKPDAPTCGHTIQTDVYNYTTASDKATVDKLVDAKVLNSGDDYSVFVSATFAKQPDCTTPTQPAPPSSTVPVPPTSSAPAPPTSTVPAPPATTVPVPPVKTSPKPVSPTKTTTRPAPPTKVVTPPAPSGTPLIPQVAATDMTAPASFHLTLSELLLIIGGGLLIIGGGFVISDVRSRRRA